MSVLPLYRVVVEDNDTIDFLSLVKYPATEQNMLKFSEESKEESKEKSKIVMSESKDRRIIVAPIALCDVPIYRVDGDYEYQIFFDKENIEKMCKNYFKYHSQTYFDKEHNYKWVDGITVYQSMIVDSELGITAPEGMDVPEGSWVVAATVNNAEVWDEIKAGKYDGLSLAGYFGLEKVNMSSQSIDNNNKELTIEDEMREMYKKLSKM